MASSMMFSAFQRACLDHGWNVERGPAISAGSPFPSYEALMDLGEVRVPLRVVEIERYPLSSDLAIGVAREEGADFILAPRIGTKQNSEFRTLSMNHADLSGRISLRSPHAVLEIEGRSAGSPMENAFSIWLQEHKRSAVVDLTSPKSAQLIFCLLTWPKLLKAPTRMISDVAGVSLGLVPRTMGYLEDQGLLRDRTWVDSGRLTVAQAWLASYRNKLGPSLHLAFMEGADDGRFKIEDAALGGGSAIPELIQSAVSTVYVPDLTAKFVRVNRLRKGDRPTVELRRLFWRTPREEFWDFHWQARGIATAPPLLVYADLITSKDPREREVAHVFLQEEPRLHWLSQSAI